MADLAPSKLADRAEVDPERCLSAMNLSQGELARLDAVEALAAAIAACDRLDALQIMCAALDDMRAGRPLPALMDIRQEARDWARFASPAELEAIASSAMVRLESLSLGLEARKRLMATIWKSLPDTSRRGFLDMVQRNGAA